MLYEPDNTRKPISRQQIGLRRGRVIDGWLDEDHRLIQVWRTRKGNLYQGPADSDAYAKTCQPVTAIAPAIAV